MPFDPNSTRKDKFFVDSETTIPVKFMHQYEFVKVHYDRDLAAKVLCLDYNDSFSMLLAVPEYGPLIKNLTYLEEEISKEHITKWMRAVAKRF